MIKKIISLLKVSIGLYIIILLSIFTFQRSIIYHETPYFETSHKEIKLGKEEKFTTLVINEKAEDAVIYFGGNAENISVTADLIKVMIKTEDKAIYFVNYRGYANSEGSPTEKGLYEDSLTIFDYVKTKHKNIKVIGKSLGSALAVNVAAKRDFEKVMLITAFDSLLNVAKEKYTYFPVEYILKDKYESIKLGSSIKENVVFLTAGRDKLITKERTDNLKKSINKELITEFIIKDANHGNIFFNKEGYKQIESFIKN